MNMFDLKQFKIDIAYPFKDQYDNLLFGIWLFRVCVLYFV